MAKNRKRGGYGFTINLTGPGTAFTVGIIALAIGFGVLLSRGVTPKESYSDPGITGDIEIVEETPDPAQKGLQLKTIKFKECSNTVTIDLLLDTSGSMGDPTPSGISKIQRLREAVLSLVEKAQDESIIGIQSFSSELIANEVPVSYYKDVKSIVPLKLAGLGHSGSTPTYEALAFSYNILKDAIPKFPPERKFNFIFVSDGAPCPGIGCPGQPGSNEDPRLYNPNPVDQIKGLGVTVYSLGIFSPQDRINAFVLEDLLKSIASTPSNYYAANTGDDIKLLLAQISNKICNAQATPSPTQ